MLAEQRRQAELLRQARDREAAERLQQDVTRRQAEERARPTIKPPDQPDREVGRDVVLKPPDQPDYRVGYTLPPPLVDVRPPQTPTQLRTYQIDQKLTDLNIVKQGNIIQQGIIDFNKYRTDVDVATTKFTGYINEANNVLANVGKYEFSGWTGTIGDKAYSGFAGYKQYAADLKAQRDKLNSDFEENNAKFSSEMGKANANLGKLKGSAVSLSIKTSGKEYVLHPYTGVDDKLAKMALEKLLEDKVVSVVGRVIKRGDTSSQSSSSGVGFTLTNPNKGLTDKQVKLLHTAGFTLTQTPITVPPPKTKADWENIIEKYDEGIRVVWIDPLTNLATDLKKTADSNTGPTWLAASIAYYGIQAPIGAVSALRGMLSPVQWINTAILGYEILKTDYAIITRDPNRVNAPVLEGFVNYMQTHPGEFIIQTAAGLMVGYYVGKATTPILKKITGKLKDDLTLIQGKSPDFPEGTVIGPKSILKKLSKFEETPTGTAAELAKIYEEMGFDKAIIEQTFKATKWDKKTGTFIEVEQSVTPETDYSASPKFDKLGEGDFAALYKQETGHGLSAADLAELEKLELVSGKKLMSQGVSDADLALAAKKMEIWENANPEMVAIIRKLSREIGDARMAIVTQDYGAVTGLVNPAVDLSAIGTGSTAVPLVIYIYTALQNKGLTLTQIQTALPVLLDREITPESLEKLDEKTLGVVIPVLSIKTLVDTIPKVDIKTLGLIIQGATLEQRRELVQRLDVKTINSLGEVLDTATMQSIIEVLDVAQIQRYDLDKIGRLHPKLRLPEGTPIRTPQQQQPPPAHKYRVVLDGRVDTVEAETFVEALSRVYKGKGARASVTRLP